MYSDKAKWEQLYRAQKGQPGDTASPFLREWADHLMAPVLDIAGGDGRNALFLARRGLEVHVIDIARHALIRLVHTARKENLPVLAIEADLDSFPLPQRYYAGIIVFRYLQRSLFPSIRKALKPGGILVYETFLREQQRIGKPKNPAYLLEPGELRQAFSDLEILFYDEGLLEQSPAAYLARLVARYPESSVGRSTQFRRAPA